jgi:uroporphyrinogen-III synthase
VVVTRPRALAAGLAGLIERAGGRPFVFPAIEIDDPADPAAALRVLGRLERFDLAIFVSRTAVQKAFELLGRQGAWPAGLPAASVGAGTAADLARQGVARVLAPASGADSEALLALPELARVAGRRIVIFRGEGGRELLGEGLAARGAVVEYAVCYRRVRPSADPAPLIAVWQAGEIHAVTVSSSEGLANLAALLGAGGRERLAATPLFVPHPRVAEDARRLGIARPLVAGPGDAEMLERLVAYFAKP